MARTITVISVTLMMIIMACLGGRIRAHVAKILVVPIPHGSHVSPLLPVLRLLREKYGHEATFVLPEYMTTNALVKNMNEKIIIADKLQQFNLQTHAREVLQMTFEGRNPLLHIIGMFNRVCDSVLSDGALMQKLAKEKFDVLIIHNMFISDCLNFLGYKLSIPIIHYGNFLDPITSGVPHNPAAVPDFPLSDYGSDMTFFQRVKNTIFFYGKALVIGIFYRFSDLSTKYVPELPYISAWELRSQVQLNLLEFDVLLDYPRPTMPNIQFVGGLNTGPAKHMDKKLQAFMDSALDGVVVCTFGSLVSEYPEKILNVITSAMKRLPKLKFVMRYGKTEKAEGNILMMPWIPQNDLLGHNNTKAFITHCGNSGQFEALYNGVPMIGLTLGGDQIYNSRRMVERGYGLRKQVASVDSDMLTSMISEVVYNATYREAIQKASEIFRSRPQTPSERAAFWVDHVLEYGGEYMQSKGTSLPFYIYFSLDVYAFMLAALCAFVYVVKLIVKCICSCIRSSKKKKEKLSKMCMLCFKKTLWRVPLSLVALTVLGRIYTPTTIVKLT